MHVARTGSASPPHEIGTSRAFAAGYRRVVTEEPLLLAFGDEAGDHVGFTLEELDSYSFIRGRIYLRTRDRAVELDGRNGIEPLARGCGQPSSSWVG